MAETPTFGRYAEIPYEQMTPEQQEAYRSLIETRGRLPGPNKIYVHNPKLAKVMGPLGAHFRTGYSLGRTARAPSGAGGRPASSPCRRRWRTTGRRAAPGSARRARPGLRGAG